MSWLEWFFKTFSRSLMAERSFSGSLFAIHLTALTPAHTTRSWDSLRHLQKIFGIVNVIKVILFFEIASNKSRVADQGVIFHVHAIRQSSSLGTAQSLLSSSQDFSQFSERSRKQKSKKILEGNGPTTTDSTSKKYKPCRTNFSWLWRRGTSIPNVPFDRETRVPAPNRPSILDQECSTNDPNPPAPCPPSYMPAATDASLLKQDAVWTTLSKSISGNRACDARHFSMNSPMPIGIHETPCGL